MVTVMFCELNSNVNHISEKSEPLWLAFMSQVLVVTDSQNLCQILNSSGLALVYRMSVSH